MPLTIRNAATGEIEAIEETMRASISSIGLEFYNARQVASAARYITVLDRHLVTDGTYFVVEEGSRLVGCGGWSRRRKLFAGSNPSGGEEEWLNPAIDAARIRAMFVRPEAARRGIGRMILRRCEEAAANAGFRRVELMATLPGVPLYLACGYTGMERSEILLPDGVVLEGLKMEKRIA